MKTFNKKTKVFLFCLATSPLLMLSESAMAACSWSGGNNSEVSVPVSFGNVIVQRDTPVNTVIATKTTGAYAGGGQLFGCTTTWTIRGDSTLFTTMSSLGGGIYDTNIAGVGIRIKSVNNEIFPVSRSVAANTYMTVPGNGFTIELIKTSAGAVGAGTLTTGRVLRWYIASATTYGANAALTGSNTITPVACSINNTTIDVNLDDASEHDFSGVGSSAKPKDFNVGLNCDAGTKVKMTLDGSHAGPAGVLSLNAGGGQASGIGIQLLKGTTPVALGTALDFGTATTAGDMQLPLTARYYQTATPIVGGTTNATATFTMTYN